MKDVQFTAFIMLAFMTAALVILLPNQVKHDPVTHRSRQLMAWGLGLLSIQFLIQYVTGLRLMGVAQAVMVNLAFFIPVAALISLSILNLQRRGRLTTIEKWAGLPAWLTAMTIIIIAILTNGDPLHHVSQRMLWTEAGASAVYALMQVYYSQLHLRELRRMEEVLDDYYDRNRHDLLLWMKVSTLVLAVLALLVPAFIFTSGWFLKIYAGFFIVGISTTWFCFTRYVITNESRRMREAEESADEEDSNGKHEVSTPATTPKMALPADEMGRIGQIVKEWTADGGHLQRGITKSDVSAQTHLSAEMLTAWYHAQGHDTFKQWMNDLRVEEAKVQLQKHPQWSNETVADHCGLSRTHFQKIFKEATGYSPADYIKTFQ